MCVTDARYVIYGWPFILLGLMWAQLLLPMPFERCKGSGSWRRIE